MDWSSLGVASQILAIIIALTRLWEFARKQAFKKNPQFPT